MSWGVCYTKHYIKVPQLSAAAGKNYQIEDMEQNFMAAQDSSKSWCLLENAAILIPENAPVASARKQPQMSPLSPEVSRVRPWSCGLIGTSWKLTSIFSCPLSVVWRGICTGSNHRDRCCLGETAGLLCTAGKNPSLLRSCSTWTFKQDDCPSIRKTPQRMTAWFMAVWWDIHDNVIGFWWNAIFYSHYWNTAGAL